MAPVGLEEPQMNMPERHVVMSFVSADDASAAVLLLHQLGLASTDVASYTPGQMRARAATVLGRACPPSPPGLEPELVVAQRELARLGHSFVLVRAGNEALLPGIRSIAAEAHAHTLHTSTDRAVQGASPLAAARSMSSPAPLGPWRTVARPFAAP